MEKDGYDEGQDMMDIDFSELAPGRGSMGSRPGKEPNSPQKLMKRLVFGVALLSVLILIIMIVLFAGDKPAKQAASPVQTQGKAIKEKAARLAAMEQGIAAVENRQKALQESIAKLERSLKSLRGDLRSMSRDLRQVRMAAQVGKETATHSGRRYHIVRKGDSPYKIAAKYGISVSDLYRLNNLTKKSIIYPGQKLAVGPVGKK